MKRIGLLVIAVLAAGLPGASPAAGATDQAHVVATLVRFVNPNPAINEGGTLTLDVVEAAIPHNIVSTDDKPDGSPLFESPTIPGPGTTNVAGVESLPVGSYGFLCTIHPSMTGTLTVEAGGSPGGLPTTPSITAGAVPTPTSIAVQDGFLYAASWGQGKIVRAQILPAGLLAPAQDYATGFTNPLGIVFGPDGTLFVADSHASSDPERSTDGRVSAIPPGGGDLAAVGEIIVDGLPNGRHNTNGMAIAGDRLYITNGNSTDDGVAGGDPETPLSGTLLSVTLDARGLTPADLDPEPVPPAPGEPPPPTPDFLVEATGMRNVYDVAFREGTDEAWMPVNGLDAQDPFGEDTLVKASTAAPPPHFGFPECVYRAGANGAEVGDNTVIEEPCGDHVPPEQLLGLHVSADGLAFGPEGDAWGGDLYIAEFGNFFGEEVVGHRVVRVPIDESGASGPPEDFFVSQAPLDVAFGPAGLYVADFSGHIYLIPSSV